MQSRGLNKESDKSDESETGLWEPYTGTSHRLPKPVSKKQLDNRVTNKRNSTGIVTSRFLDTDSEEQAHPSRLHRSAVSRLQLQVAWPPQPTADQ
jgi:hypothetical protein